jgi:capsular exopolysaccharide synthesis family protein
VYPGPSHSFTRPELVANEGIPWRRALAVLYKHWKASLAFVLAIQIALALLVFSLDDSYEARATIEIEPPSNAVSLAGQPAAVTTPAQQDYVGTQTEILRGESLAMSVIEELKLAENPTFLKQSWVEKLPARVISWVMPARRSSGNSQMDRLLETYGGRLTVAQVRTSRLVEIRYESFDPQLSAQIVNTAVRRYLETTHRSKYEATLRAAESLAPELNELKNTVEQSNRALLEFQRTHEGVELAGSGTAGSAGAGSTNPVSNRVSQLNEQLTEAMGERLHQESYMALLAAGKNDALPQMSEDPVIRELTTQVADVRAQLAQALSVYGRNNPQVRRLEMQSQELTAQLEAQRGRIADQVRSAHASAVRKEELIRRTLSDMKGTLDASNVSVARYETLKREADANSNLYVALSSRIKELAVSGSLNANNIRVVDEARVPEQPSGPRRMRILAVGLLFGLVGGVALAFVAEGMDDTISSVDDLRGWSKLPALALVPQVSSKNGHGLAPPARAVLSLPMQASMALKGKGPKIFADTSHSPEAEAIRNLDTAIRLSGLSDDRRVQTVLITSAFPGEGKTTVAVNLALALSRHGKTCLVDADVRHPAITSYFGLSLRPGLQDLLVKPQLLKEVCTPLTERPSLVALGVGMRRAEALSMLTSQRMRSLTDELRKSFDYVVFDSPPIIPFSDARWLSKLSDGSVLVARSSTTTRRAMMWSIDILEELNASLLGIVLNGVNLESDYYGYGADHKSCK